MNYRKKVYANEPISFCGNEKADIRFYDGALRHAIGTKQYQVVRANREHPETQDDYGWTYNHAPMICFWNGRFFVEYLSDRVGEHEPPSHTLLTWSENGKDWVKPVVVFPEYPLPEGVYTGPKKELLKKGDTAIMHQRMGFYITKDNRLFVLGFYGVSPEIHTNPNNGYGIARVVREVYEDLTFSPIYVIRYNEYGGFKKENVEFPFYKESEDEGFIKGCDELLSNKLVVRQWWEEQRFDTELFKQPSAAAFCYYTTDDNKVIGLYKNSLVNVSEDGGETWSEFVRCASIATSTAKMWGERTEDGNYALVYVPSTDSMHRWPLAVATSPDGRHFYNLLALTTQVPPTRYVGAMKNLGPQYVRGICEGYPKPEDGHMWLTYSMNKEDIWVCKLPVPITGVETEPVNESFKSEKDIFKWNVYSPKWCRVDVSEEDKCLVLRDSDPYDKAVAERTFIESLVLTLETEIIPKSIGEAGLYIDITDKAGSVAVRILFKKDFGIYIRTNGVYNKAAEYEIDKSYNIKIINADCVLNTFTVVITCEGEEIYKKTHKFNASVNSLERFVLQTKDKVNIYDLESNGKDGSMKDLPGSGEQQKETRFNILMLKTSDHITDEE